STYVLVVTAVALLAYGAIAERPERRLPTWTLVPTVLALVLVGVADGPSAFWRHTAIGVGRVQADFDGPNGLRDLLHVVQRGVVDQDDGVESAVALVRDNDLALIVNGKSDGSARGDAATNVTSALIGSALHPDPKRVLVIGLGTGVTAGWFAQVPSVERVDVVELEPAVVRFADAFAAVHFDALNDPKVHLIYGDGREHVLAHAGEYDIIFSEPSNPYRVGVADLFSQDFYRAVVERLGDDGIFLQWLQGYDVDPRVIQGVYATLGSVFPSIETWKVHRKDLLLVATEQPITHDRSRLRRRIQRDPWAAGFRRVWGVDGLDGFYSGFVGGDRLARALAEGSTLAISTDDRPTIEFGFARGVGRVGEFDLGKIGRLARSLGTDRPALATRVEREWVDWQVVAELAASRGTLVAFNAAGVDVGGGVGTGADALDGDAARRQAARRAWADGELATAAGLWSGQGGRPLSPLDRLMLGELTAAAPGVDPAEAAARIDEVAVHWPTEAAALRARRAWGHDDASRDVEATTVALLDAFERLRSDAWAQIGVLQRAFQLTKAVATVSPEHGRRLFAALDQPFAARLFEEVRLATRINLAGRIDFAGLCAEAFAEFEPYPTWDRRFLEARVRCYTNGDSRLARRAEDDLVTFLAAAAEPLRAPAR
ncbi:MAG: fused MFS/spermidine synthase, partial [Acidobacteriota bacterium]